MANEVVGGTEPFEVGAVQMTHSEPEPRTWSEGVDIPPGPEDYLPPHQPLITSIADDIWATFREWFGKQGPIDELGLMEQRAKITGQHPLEVLRHTIRFVINNGLWG